MAQDAPFSAHITSSSTISTWVELIVMINYDNIIVSDSSLGSSTSTSFGSFLNLLLPTPMSLLGTFPQQDIIAAILWTTG